MPGGISVSASNRATGANDGIVHLGQQRIEKVTPARMQIVGLPELRHSAPVPPPPRLAGRARHRRAIALQHRQLALPGQHQRHRQPDHPAAQHDDP
jgi:hypothetical protein